MGSFFPVSAWFPVSALWKFAAAGCLLAVCIIQPALARRLLNRWTTERGLTLHEAARLWLGSSAFRFGLLDTRVVFRIRVTDAAGEARTGVARAGYRWLCLSPRVDVAWDAAPAGAP